MIRFTDAAILAYTKLRTHKIRTGLTTGVAGILFGLIFAVIIVVTGVFASVEKFSEEGLGNRTILSITSFKQMSFQLYAHLSDESFVAEVEQVRADYITHKAQVSKKYAIAYNPNTEDPSPIAINAATKKKYIPDESMNNQFVQIAANKHYASEPPAFNVNDYTKPYKTTTVLTGNYDIAPTDGSLMYMKDGKENQSSTGGPSTGIDMMQMPMPDSQQPALSVMNQQITAPFVLSNTFDYSKGEVPVVISFSQAERMLGYKKLAKNATIEQKTQRMQAVRANISKATASYCYRNQASQNLLAEAIIQAADIAKNAGNKDYQAPQVQYAVPASDSCGPVTITKNTRTAAEKKAAETRRQYEIELGTYAGDPQQHKMTVRGVGIASDLSVDGGMSGTVGQLVTSLLGSWLGYGNYFVVPLDMLHKLPESARPTSIFPVDDKTPRNVGDVGRYERYLIEFSDKEEARTAINKAGGSFGQTSELMVTPFGSASIIVDEMKALFGKVLWWTLATVGTVALIILAGLIGRMVSDGRRESAVFRAIGARRSDIGAIYGVYTLLLSLRVALFALGLGVVLALIVEIIFHNDATLGARLAYAASDTTKEFYLFGMNSWYLVIVFAAIIIVGLLASVVPILLGARRNPIKDMRDDS